MPARRPLEERFWEKVNKEGQMQPHMTTPCWVWLGATSGGYGMLGLGDGKVGKAHKVSWLIHFGPIPKGACVLHKCDVPGCPNPDHLYLGTQKDNAADRERRGRGNQVSGDAHGSKTQPERLARGADHGNAVLTNEQVTELRAAFTGKYGEQKMLAKKYGVDVQTIRRVTHGLTYKKEG